MKVQTCKRRFSTSSNNASTSGLIGSSSSSSEFPGSTYGSTCIELWFMGRFRAEARDEWNCVVMGGIGGGTVGTCDGND